MSGLKQACARFLSLFWRETLDREFDEEAQSHLDLAVEDYMRRGMPEAEARRLARIKFGAVQASKDAHRDSRGLAWLDGILYDLRFALRGARRDRAFTVTAILILALAIGLNATVFTVMNTMLFRGYRLVKRNDQLLFMAERNPSGFCCITYLDFVDWWAQAKSFQGMALVSGDTATLSDGSGPGVDIFVNSFTANALQLLGVQPMLGRDFVAADEAPGAPPVAILTYHFWQERFGKRANIVGHTVRINKIPTTIIGVMPEGFDFPSRRDLWIPLPHTPRMQQRLPMGAEAFGRLAEGATPRSARTELETINRRLANAYPATNRNVVPIVRDYTQFFAGSEGPMIYGSLWAAAWFVLVIACANLANLTLERTMGRSREFSTRIALGAGHWRMVRQIFIESLLLAGAGGALGWWMTKWSVRTWAAATASRYQVLDYTLGYETLAYLVAISIAAALMFGLLPSLRVLQLDVNGILKGDARGTTRGRRSRHLSAALVAGQMALAIVLLSGAGVLVRSVWMIVAADVGVNATEKVLLGQLVLPLDKYPTPQSRIVFFTALRERLAALPGVESAAVSQGKPLEDVEPKSVELEQGNERHSIPIYSASAGYFGTVGATMIAGRDFDDHDLPASAPVAIVNQRFVEAFLPGQNPVGQRFRVYAKGQSVPGGWRTIVGVASNIMQNEATRQHFLPLVYLPLPQAPDRFEYFFARTHDVSDAVSAAVQAEVHKIDPDLAMFEFSTLSASLGFHPADQYRLELGKQAAVAPIFAVMALLLAAVGLYSVIAHSVSQRTKEIGVRMALGGAAGDIRRLIFREGMLPVAFGLIVGLTVSLAVNRILQSQLVGVSPYDPVTLTAAPAVLILVASVACQIPSRRALRVDPAVALRHD